MAGTSNMAGSRLHSIGKSITGGQREFDLQVRLGKEKERGRHKGGAGRAAMVSQIEGAVIMPCFILFLPVMKLIISKY